MSRADRMEGTLVTNTMPMLMLFPDAYPHVFLTAELDVLAKTFDITVIPCTNDSGRDIKHSDRVRVDMGLSEALTHTRLNISSTARALLSPSVYTEAVRQAPLGLRPRGFLTIVRRYARALAVESWTRKELVPRMQGGSCIAYTWWSAAYSLGVARALRFTGVPMVTRAHGYDLYAEQEAIGFVPFQRQLLAQVTLALSVSEDGSKRLQRLYPDLAARIQTSYLGIEAPGQSAPSSSDGVLRITTCSALVEVKRVDLLARALMVLAQNHPEIDFLWTHIGDGPSRKNVEAIVVDGGLADRVVFMGGLEHAAVLQWLGDCPTDLFVNVSRSEGLPVTLMEAASLGIPMLVTRVGGNAEIVADGAGWVISSDPTERELAEELARFAALDAAERAHMRQAAVQTFEARFLAERNYAALAVTLQRQLHAED